VRYLAIGSHTDRRGGARGARSRKGGADCGVSGRGDGAGAEERQRGKREGNGDIDPREMKPGGHGRHEHGGRQSVGIKKLG